MPRPPAPARRRPPAQPPARRDPTRSRPRLPIPNLERAACRGIAVAALLGLAAWAAVIALLILAVQQLR